MAGLHRFPGRIPALIVEPPDQPGKLSTEVGMGSLERRTENIEAGVTLIGRLLVAPSSSRWFGLLTCCRGGAKEKVGFARQMEAQLTTCRPSR